MNQRTVSTIGVSILVLAWAACGGGSAGKADTFEPIDISYSEEIPSFPDIVGQPEREEPPEPKYRYEIILLHDTSQPQSIMVGQDFNIHAKVIDYKDQMPAPNVLLQWDLTVTDLNGQEATGDGALAATMSYTDEGGNAGNTFVAGLEPERLYTITVAADEAESQSMQIAVTAGPCGCVDVSLKYQGALDPSSINTIQVHVLSNEYTCDILFPEKEVPPTLGDRTITDLYGTTQFECIPADNRYTIFATAKGPFGCVAASGCDDGVYIQPKKCYKATLPLHLVVLNPTGKYDCTDHFDFTPLVQQCAGGDTTILKCATGVGDIGKAVCCVIAELIKFFKTPGLTIIETIQDLAKQWLGSLIVDTAFGLFKDAVADIITDWLKNKSPSWLKDFFTIGEDMLGVITNLELLSNLLISKLQNDFSVQGTQYWKGLVLYWKFGCSPSDPNYETCGKMTFSLDDLKTTNFPLDLVEGKFHATIADFNAIYIDQHAIKLNYGKLVLFVLNEIVIAGITKGKAHSLKEVALLWIDCKSVGQGIFGEIASWFGGSPSDVENVCVGAINFLLTPVDLFVGALTLDTELSLQGNAKLVDDDCDLRVDRIIQGSYVGQVQSSASSQASFTGKFEAVKQK